MAPNICSYKNTSPGSAGYNDLDALGILPDKRPDSKQYMRSSPYHSFCQVYWGNLLNNNKVLHRVVFLGSHQLSWSRKPPRMPLRSVKIMSILLALLPPTTVLFFCCKISFVGISISIGIRELKISCFKLSSKLFFERVWVTQRFLYISPRVVLDKTPNTSGRKFGIGHLTSSPIYLYPAWYWWSPKRV